MGVPKRLRALIGQKFDKEAFNEAAAHHGIRLTRVFASTHDIDENGRSVINNRNSSCYYDSFSRFKVKLRERYLEKVLKKKCPDIYEQYNALDHFIKHTAKHHPEYDFDEIMNEACVQMGTALNTLEDTLEAVQAVLQEELEKIEPVLERGYVLPWERFKLRVTERINLPELPRNQYKGKEAKALLDGDVISAIEIT